MDNDRELEQMLQANHNRKKELETETLKDFERALKTSVTDKKLEHKQNKKKKAKQKAITAIATILVMLTVAKLAGPTIISKGTDIKNDIIATIQNSDEIDTKIGYYSKLMNHNGERSIETITGRNFEKNEAYVDYTFDNINTLAAIINEAAKESEVETRCVIIAAYKIINEPYREQVLNRAFERANQLAKESGEEYTCSYLYENGTTGFLQGLEYENWNDYNEHERENIKDLNNLQNKGRGKI